MEERFERFARASNYDPVAFMGLLGACADHTVSRELQRLQDEAHARAEAAYAEHLAALVAKYPTKDEGE